MSKSEKFYLVRRVLLENDPIGIYFKEDRNVDEYDPEAKDIVSGMPDCNSIEDVRNLAWEVFVRFFDKKIAGPKEKYDAIASRLWHEWNK